MEFAECFDFTDLITTVSHGFFDVNLRGQVFILEKLEFSSVTNIIQPLRIMDPSCQDTFVQFTNDAFHDHRNGRLKVAKDGKQAKQGEQATHREGMSVFISCFSLARARRQFPKPLFSFRIPSSFDS